MLEGESTTERFFIPAHGADDDALSAGFAWLRHFASEGGYSKGAVFVPGLREVEALARAIGQSAARALEKDRSLRDGDITIDLLIERGLPYAYKDGPVLAVWVDDQQLDKLDGLRAPALCAIPWNPDHIDGWKLNWNPTDARTGDPSGHEDTVSNPVVVAALESLTARVNVGDGLTHTSDKAAAVELFKVLTSAREAYEPSEVRAWAVRRGWSAKHARDLSDIAQKVKDGRRVQTRGRGGWRDNVIDVWRDDASQQSQS